MINRNFVLALAASSMLSACATIVTGATQSIKIDSNPEGATVYTGTKSGNDAARFDSTAAGVTPITVSIPRKDGVVRVSKNGYEDAEVPLTRDMNGWVWGDIALLSLLSTSIDTSTGASKKYDPDQYLVDLKPAHPVQPEPPLK